MIKTMEQLALLGGQPLRNKPFASPVVIDEREKERVLEVLANKEISRFMGSPSADIDEQLVMKSAQARDHNTQYFSFLGGRMIKGFEADFAEKFGVDYAISVNSATSGLSAAVGTCGVNPGDEVITTCLSFNATATSILVFDAVPVFVDVDPDNYCLDPEAIEKKITARTKAILVVHLLGHAADMDAIMAIAKRHGLVVIEDCAQAIGTQYKGRLVGTIGDMGVFSFQETKNITTGEGGMIVTNNPEYARKCRLIRNHGESVPDENTPEEALVNNIGFNFRMTELTAALGIEQLKKLDENNRVRHENACYLAKHLQNWPGLEVPKVVTEDGHICHVFPLIYTEEETGVSREAVLQALRAEGIVVGSGYLRLMPQNPIFARKVAYGNQGFPFSNQDYDAKNFPVASELIDKKFIWFYHVNRPNTTKDMEDVVRAFKKVFSSLDQLKGYQTTGQKKIYKW